ncbi:MAG: type III pantothenate kinase [bacterium]
MNNYLLAIDVGNSTIVFGLFENGSLIEKWRIITRKMSADELGLWLCSAFAQSSINLDLIEGIVICSVVPSLDTIFNQACKLFLDTEPLFITAKETADFLPISYPKVQQIGADRLANAVAIYERYKCPVIIVDFGTATTFCAVTPESGFLGGCIVPGVGISLDALVSKAERLNPVVWEFPRRIIAEDTSDAVRSGVFFGYSALVDGVVERMQNELGTKTKVIATGGWADVFFQGAESIDEVIPDLTLEGLRIIFEKQRHGISC